MYSPFQSAIAHLRYCGSNRNFKGPNFSGIYRHKQRHVDV
ncbi:Uncharacterised protein [Vibrio cholerae]|uniref:Uncharacterized protein n=1 Tax=Vibrio cholerae TaxID=666 RepID=A0A655WM18_VIBCL|nr:Uncharacterised protein [Vibrio cholerae]CSC66418.1 Uncharacterised protein [Vibrio cholerae]